MEKWQIIEEMIKNSDKNIRILPYSKYAYYDVIGNFKLTEGTTIEAVMKNCGGIIVDDRIRIYGSGEMNFAAINNEFPEFGTLVGEDILGGLFVMEDNGNMAYFSPDSLLLEDMELNYSQFITWAVSGDTELFYSNYMWDGWKDDLAKIDLNEGILFHPFLWASADKADKRKRKIVPMSEIIGLELEFVK